MNWFFLPPGYTIRIFILFRFHLFTVGDWQQQVCMCGVLALCAHMNVCFLFIGIPYFVANSFRSHAQTRKPISINFLFLCYSEEFFEWLFIQQQYTKLILIKHSEWCMSAGIAFGNNYVLPVGGECEIDKITKIEQNVSNLKSKRKTTCM